MSPTEKRAGSRSRRGELRKRSRRPRQEGTGPRLRSPDRSFWVLACLSCAAGTHSPTRIIRRSFAPKAQGYGVAMGTGVVVITGASLGVGRATAIAFARAGYDVALVARAAESLDAATAQVEASGSGRALACPADVSVAAEVDAARQAGRGRARPDRRVGQLRDGVRLLARRPVRPGRGAPHHGGHLSRLRPRDAGRAATHAPRAIAA